jgi:uncharacterized protein involved in response to NO
MNMTLLRIDEPARTAPTGWAPFALGFRSFFLGAGVAAVLLMAAWIAMLNGLMQPPGALDAATWHAHEMLFGYAGAVIGGFLLTAVQTWTGIKMPSGRPLAALFAVWLGARLLPFVPGASAGLIAALNLLYFAGVLVAVSRPVLRIRQKRNYAFPAMLGMLTLACALVHTEALGLAADTARLGLNLALSMIVMMMAIMGGRVIPSFTDSRLGTHGKRWSLIETTVPWLTLAALAALAFDAPGMLSAVLCAAAALLHGVRLSGWNTARTRTAPLLWVLHAGYAWIAIGFALAAGAALSAWPATLATHAFTGGAIGVLTLGMMARVALGHTGRMLESARVIDLAFVLVNLAALLRVGLPLLAPDATGAAHLLGGLAWSAAFALFVFHYTPILLRPRVDGKPG